MNEEVPPEVGAVQLEAAPEPRHRGREQAPQVPEGEAREECLRPSVGIGREAVVGEVDLRARDEPQQRPQPEPANPAPVHAPKTTPDVRRASDLAGEVRVPNAVPEVNDHADHEPNEEPQGLTLA